MGWAATIASASLASRAEIDGVADALQDALERAAIQLLVVDDEHVGFALQVVPPRRMGGAAGV